jgi:DNA-binding NarL/FixJ family response regulator
MTSRYRDEASSGGFAGHRLGELTVTIETDISDGIGDRMTGLDLSDAASPDAASLTMMWVDAAQLSRECLVSAVRAAQPHFLIHPVESVEDCLRLQELRPELVVYYCHAEDTVDIRAVQALHTAYPQARLVILSDASTLTPTLVRDILSHDVAGFILTHRTGLQLVISAISLVHSGGTFVPRDFIFMNGEAAPSSTGRKASETGRLTQRELAVLDLIRLGHSNKLVAETLGMSASTVKVHVRNIMQKMGVSNRTQVALTADQYIGAGRQQQT